MLGKIISESEKIKYQSLNIDNIKNKQSKKNCYWYEHLEWVYNYYY